MALGAVGVTLMELTAAYGRLPWGIYNAPVVITRSSIVKAKCTRALSGGAASHQSGSGVSHDQYAAKCHPALEARALRVSDVQPRADWHDQDYDDAWFVGYTPEL